MIKYKSIHGKIRVYLGNRRVGTIESDTQNEKLGVRYYPKNDNVGGEWFPTVSECKRSLEAV